MLACTRPPRGQLLFYRPVATTSQPRITTALARSQMGSRLPEGPAPLPGLARSSHASGENTPKQRHAALGNISKGLRNPETILLPWGAGGGTRTRMGKARAILSRLRLPFHHTGWTDYRGRRCGPVYPGISLPVNGRRPQCRPKVTLCPQAAAEGEGLPGERGERPPRCGLPRHPHDAARCSGSGGPRGRPGLRTPHVRGTVDTNQQEASRRRRARPFSSNLPRKAAYRDAPPLHS